MIDACRTQGKAENLKWVWECAETGRVPTLGAVNPEEKEDRAKWGITERVGSAAFSYPIEVVRTTCHLASTQAFFEVPRSGSRGLDMAAAAAAAAEMPSVHYTRVARTPAGTQVRAREKKKPPRKAARGAVFAESVYRRQARRERLQAGEELTDAQASEADSEPVEIKSGPIKWGPPWEDCKVGNYCVSRAIWNDGPGIQVGKVTSVMQNVKTCTVALLKCSKRQHQKSCVNGRWTQTRDEDTIEYSTAVAFFPSLNKGHKSLPVQVRSHLLETARYWFARARLP